MENSTSNNLNLAESANIVNEERDDTDTAENNNISTMGSNNINITCSAADKTTNENFAQKLNKKINNKTKFIAVAIAFVLIITSITIGTSGFKESKDLVVCSTYYNAEEKRCRFCVKNIGDEQIVNFTVAVVGYNSSGNMLHLGEDSIYMTKSFHQTNIFPKDIYINDNDIGIDIGIMPENIKYIKATVIEITYFDGDKWESSDPDKWVKKLPKNLDVESFKKNLFLNANKAKYNPYLEIGSEYALERESYRVYGKYDLTLDFKNISDKNISKYKIVCAEFESNYHATSLGASGFISDNATLLEVNNNDLKINAGNSKSIIFYDAIGASTSKLDTIVYSIEFDDGTTWSNEYALEWLNANEYDHMQYSEYIDLLETTNEK